MGISYHDIKYRFKEYVTYHSELDEWMYHVRDCDHCDEPLLCHFKTNGEPDYATIIAHDCGGVVKD